MAKNSAVEIKVNHTIADGEAECALADSQVGHQRWPLTAVSSRSGKFIRSRSHSAASPIVSVQPVMFSERNQQQIEDPTHV